MNRTDEDSPTSRLLVRLAKCVSLFCCALVLLNSLAVWQIFPHTLITRATRDWERGAALYGDPLTYPFLGAAYGWLNYASLRALRAVTDLDTAGRLFNVLGSLLLCAAVAVAAARITRQRLLTLAAVGMLAPMTILFGMHQPDRFAATLEILALALFISRTTRRSAAFAGVIAGCAILGKANALGALGGIVLGGFLTRDTRRAWLAAAFGAATLVVLTALLELWSGGNYLRGLAYVALDDAKSLWTAYDNLLPVLSMMGPLLASLVAALLLGGYRSKPVRILACALLGSVAIALLGSTKAGAGPSYYITVVCILALMTVAALVELPANLKFPLVVALGLASLVAAVPSREMLSAWEHSVRFDRSPGVEAASAVLAQMPPGPLWSENGKLACSTSRPVIADDAHSLHRAVLSGRMSMEPVLRTLREQRAAVLVLNEKPYPDMPSFLFHVELDATSRQFSCAAWASYEIRARAAGAIFLVPRAVQLDEANCKAEELPWWVR